MAAMAAPLTAIRPATLADWDAIQPLLTDAGYLHTHSDWHKPRAWLLRHPFMLAWSGGRLAGILAAPPDPPDLAWLRFAGVAAGFSGPKVLGELWAACRKELLAAGVQRSAILTTNSHLDELLPQWGFAASEEVLVLTHNTKVHEPPLKSAALIRRARPEDCDAVAAVDWTAFETPWRHSPGMVAAAMAQASFVTVALVDRTIVGHQFTTEGRSGAHMARLAVHPNWQGKHIGRALVDHMLRHYAESGVSPVGVNTQSNNAASLALYRALGFKLTGEGYQVWQRWLA